MASRIAACSRTRRSSLPPSGACRNRMRSRCAFFAWMALQRSPTPARAKSAAWTEPPVQSVSHSMDGWFCPIRLCPESAGKPWTGTRNRMRGQVAERAGRFHDPQENLQRNEAVERIDLVQQLPSGGLDETALTTSACAQSKPSSGRAIALSPGAATSPTVPSYGRQKRRHLHRQSGASHRRRPLSGAASPVLKSVSMMSFGTR
jgi:hypothetical protein